MQGNRISRNAVRVRCRLNLNRPPHVVRHQVNLCPVLQLHADVKHVNRDARPIVLRRVLHVYREISGQRVNQLVPLILQLQCRIPQNLAVLNGNVQIANLFQASVHVWHHGLVELLDQVLLDSLDVRRVLVNRVQENLARRTYQ